MEEFMEEFPKNSQSKFWKNQRNLQMHFQEKMPKEKN